MWGEATGSFALPTWSQCYPTLHGPKRTGWGLHPGTQPQGAGEEGVWVCFPVAKEPGIAAQW